MQPQEKSRHSVSQRRWIPSLRNKKRPRLQLKETRAFVVPLFFTACVRITQNRLFPCNAGGAPRLPPDRAFFAVLRGECACRPPAALQQMAALCWVGAKLRLHFIAGYKVKAGLSIDAVILPCTAMFVNHTPAISGIFVVQPRIRVSRASRGRACCTWRSRNAGHTAAVFRYPYSRRKCGDPCRFR